MGENRAKIGSRRQGLWIEFTPGIPLSLKGRFGWAVSVAHPNQSLGSMA